MGKARKSRKFAATKRLISPNDQRIKSNQLDNEKKKESQKGQESIDGEKLNRVQKVSSSMFLSYNTSLGPPYNVLIDTNFINFSITNKLDIMISMIDCLLGKVNVCVTQCVIGELEKLGTKYRVALRIAKDTRFHRLPCTHKGTYADDCIVSRCMQHKCYIVATCDRDLKRRIRKIPGIPIMYIASHKYAIERMPNAVGLKSGGR